MINLTKSRCVYLGWKNIGYCYMQNNQPSNDVSRYAFYLSKLVETFAIWNNIDLISWRQMRLFLYVKPFNKHKIRVLLGLTTLSENISLTKNHNALRMMRCVHLLQGLTHTFYEAIDPLCFSSKGIVTHCVVVVACYIKRRKFSFMFHSTNVVIVMG